MDKIALIFPGQGSQFVGMGKDLLDSYPIAGEVFDVADSELGFDLSTICFDGPEERLRETRFTQVAILVHSVAVWRILEAKGIKPDFVAGHSVGEYSALVASGSLAFADALRVVKARGEAMFDSGVEQPGAMAAIIGMPADNLDGFLQEARKAGIIEPANYNSPVQVVVSGDVAAIEKATEIARSHGAKRAIRLKVSGAFHSPLMKTAQQKLASTLGTVDFSQAKIPVVSNVTAEAVTQPAEIVGLLEKQLTNPVLWHQSMDYMVEHGVGSFVEVGPGKVLCGLLKRIKPEAVCVSCSDADTIGGFLREVSA
jgi:[acyl-carrier-protein] S-malonyltransferase